ncbi:hypothetical protein JXB02_00090 [Candidatus Woesearchaeota archaeon]|nr:hypothetical protein [Candidatus Woesearchaeota archaeon]
MIHNKTIRRIAMGGLIVGSNIIAAIGAYNIGHVKGYVEGVDDAIYEADAEVRFAVGNAREVRDEYKKDLKRLYDRWEAHHRREHVDFTEMPDYMRINDRIRGAVTACDELSDLVWDLNEIPHILREKYEGK